MRRNNSIRIIMNKRRLRRYEYFCRCHRKKTSTSEVSTMNTNDIMITGFDYGRIMSMIDQMRDAFSKEQKENAEKLVMELKRARKVDSSAIPRDYVTMNSIFEIKEMDESDTRTLVLVFPEKANIEENRVSILSPVGTAVLGYRVGNVIHWKVPAGVKKFIITRMLYQPEAAGDYHL
ncbi:MAG TPA: nucleoside diphosphate kinase regulator [Spirochaetota bacterium]|nr:nucleoside diphosphate kinase regulator [Spirochaetota bacterium]HPL15929.1 nucleoside diphosphate kinase regulator [Spirochaetota bacterium]HPV42174.1 nucleoside diphosphate kinase regulator [Spirochaetota bacterium]